jgi:hypothetical protein
MAHHIHCAHGVPRQLRPTRRQIRAMGVCIALVIASRGARGQRTTYTNLNSWYIVGADVALTDRWSVLLDTQMRRSGPIDETQSLFFRPALIYSLSPNIKLGYGVSRSESFPYGKIPNAYRAPEWRQFQQVQLSHSIDRVAFTHRYRLEQRWLGRRGADTSDHRIETWTRLSRFRYQLKATIPLRGDGVDVGEAYLTAGDEVLLGFGRNVALNVFDQNRLSTAVGWRFATSWRAEVGFLEQLLLKSNGRDMERNHTLTAGMFYSRPRSRTPR